ncbi:MAG: hypothetical protein NC548_34595 [Lachnospiraceae bacterium]|nr:hypothetical protein [Lachnospiraceae bacterium]MCM1231485.1 hypothetical protein [Ruminococcus flavefaciens]
MGTKIENPHNTMLAKGQPLEPRFKKQIEKGILKNGRKEQEKQVPEVAELSVE